MNHNLSIIPESQSLFYYNQRVYEIVSDGGILQHQFSNHRSISTVRQILLNTILELDQSVRSIIARSVPSSPLPLFSAGKIAFLARHDCTGMNGIQDEESHGHGERVEKVQKDFVVGGVTGIAVRVLS